MMGKVFLNNLSENETNAKSLLDFLNLFIKKKKKKKKKNFPFIFLSFPC